MSTNGSFPRIDQLTPSSRPGDVGTGRRSSSGADAERFERYLRDAAAEPPRAERNRPDRPPVEPASRRSPQTPDRRPPVNRHAAEDRHERPERADDGGRQGVEDGQTTVERRSDERGSDGGPADDDRSSTDDGAAGETASDGGNGEEGGSTTEHAGSGEPTSDPAGRHGDGHAPGAGPVDHLAEGGEGAAAGPSVELDLEVGGTTATGGDPDEAPDGAAGIASTGGEPGASTGAGQDHPPATTATGGAANGTAAPSAPSAGADTSSQVEPTAAPAEDGERPVETTDGAAAPGEPGVDGTPAVSAPGSEDGHPTTPVADDGVEPTGDGPSRTTDPSAVPGVATGRVPQAPVGPTPDPAAAQATGDAGHTASVEDQPVQPTGSGAATPARGAGTTGPDRPVAGDRSITSPTEPVPTAGTAGATIDQADATATATGADGEAAANGEPAPSPTVPTAGPAAGRTGAVDTAGQASSIAAPGQVEIVDAGPTPAGSTDAADRGDPLWQQIRRAIGNLRTLPTGDQLVRIRLRPAELGSVLVRINTGESGTAVSLVTETSAAANQLNQQRQQLISELEDGGLTDIDVDIDTGEGADRSDGETVDEDTAELPSTIGATGSVADEMAAAFGSRRARRPSAGLVDLDL